MGVSFANAAKPSQNGQNYSALPLPSKASGYARHMEGEVPALKLKLAISVVLKRKPFMGGKHAKRELNVA